jgi:hypothetical protein
LRRLILALCAPLAFGALTPMGVAADLATQTQATLSCSDGHSVVMSLDQTGLTNLLGEVQAINTGGLMTCAVTTDTSNDTADWTVYDYNPSGQAIAPRHSPNSLPATTSGSTTTFTFRNGVYTALLTTTDSGLTGNKSSTTLTDTVRLHGNSGATFTSQNGDGCSTPPTARFYFTSPAASGQSVGPPPPGNPPAGFYTQFWWSNPVAVTLVADGQTGPPITADMMNPSEWSDWDGKGGTSQPEAFAEATRKVQSIGLSFGGGCFFENGVTALSNDNSTEQLSSTFTESS